MFDNRFVLVFEKIHGCNHWNIKFFFNILGRFNGGIKVLQEKSKTDPAEKPQNKPQQNISLLIRRCRKLRNPCLFNHPDIDRLALLGDSFFLYLFDQCIVKKAVGFNLSFQDFKLDGLFPKLRCLEFALIQKFFEALFIGYGKLVLVFNGLHRLVQFRVFLFLQISQFVFRRHHPGMFRTVLFRQFGYFLLSNKYGPVDGIHRSIFYNGRDGFQIISGYVFNLAVNRFKFFSLCFSLGHFSGQIGKSFGQHRQSVFNRYNIVFFFIGMENPLGLFQAFSLEIGLFFHPTDTVPGRLHLHLHQFFNIGLGYGINNFGGYGRIVGHKTDLHHPGVGYRFSCNPILNDFFQLLSLGQGNCLNAGFAGNLFIF